MHQRDWFEQTGRRLADEGGLPGGEFKTTLHQKSDERQAAEPHQRTALETPSVFDQALRDEAEKGRIDSGKSTVTREVGLQPEYGEREAEADTDDETRETGAMREAVARRFPVVSGPLRLAEVRLGDDAQQHEGGRVPGKMWPAEMNAVSRHQPPELRCSDA